MVLSNLDTGLIRKYAHLTGVSPESVQRMADLTPGELEQWCVEARDEIKKDEFLKAEERAQLLGRIDTIIVELNKLAVAA